jgi:hypothetical protein
MDDLERKSRPKTSGSSGVAIHVDRVGERDKRSPPSSPKLVRLQYQ